MISVREKQRKDETVDGGEIEEERKSIDRLNFGVLNYT